MSCPIQVNSSKIELTVDTSCYCVLDLLCVKWDNDKERKKRVYRQGERQNEKEDRSWYIFKLESFLSFGMHFKYFVSAEKYLPC